MADVRVRPISSGEVIYDTLRMTQTLLPAILLVTGLLQGVQSQSCNPACSSDELCNFGVCQQVTNCECVVHNKADKCDYTRRTGNDAQACKDAGCCWNAAKTKCQKKNAEQQPSGDACTRMIPKADRTFAGWYKIAPSDCVCMGGCYDGDSSGNYKCFEPASPKSSACPPGMYYKEGLDSCYLQVTERKTWDESQQHCARLSATAHMVEVGSQAEHDYVKKVMDGRHMWYGARRVSGGGVNDIEWTHSGTPVKSFTNWECNQPDQQSDGSRNAADCVIGYSQYRWYDTSCDRKVAFLCEASPGPWLGLGDKCKTTDVCSLPNSVCYLGVCTCASLFKQSVGRCVSTTGPRCGSGPACTDPNAACLKGACTCKPNYKLENGVCAKEVNVGDVCGATAVCKDPNASCAGGVCACNAGYHNKNRACTPPVDVGGPCGAADVCKDPNAVCTNGQCQCTVKFNFRDGVCKEICKKRIMDIVFVIDNSGSIDVTEMAGQKLFLEKLTESFTIDNHDTRVGLVRYGTASRVLNPLNSRNTRKDVVGDLGALAVAKEWTNTPAGLIEMTNLFNTQGGSNQKFGVLLTDGKSNRGILKTAIRGIPADVTMFSVGVDGYVKSELEEIAGDANRVYATHEFDELIKLIPQIRDDICPP